MLSYGPKHPGTRFQAFQDFIFILAHIMCATRGQNTITKCNAWQTVIYKNTT